MMALRSRWARRASSGAGLVCLLLLAELNGERFDIAGLLSTSHDIQIALLLGGCTLLAWGLAGGTPRSQRDGQRSDLFLLTAALLLAFAVRTWQLEDAVHFFVDEGNFVEGLLNLENKPDINLLGPFNWIAQFTWLYTYFQAQSVAILGRNLVGIRALSAALGLLTVPAVYLLARTLFDRRAGLLAAFLLAAFPPHIHFSRLGLNNIADPLFGTLALVCLARGMRSGRSGDYVLGGVFLGLTQYFYEGGRLVFPALALAWGLLATLAWRRRFVVFVKAALVAALVAMPIYYTLSSWNFSFTERLNDQGLTASYWAVVLLSRFQDGYLEIYWQHQLSPPLQHFVTLPDASQFYYGGETALILPFMLPFFALGFVAAVRRSITGAALLALWLFFTAFGNSLLGSNVWTARYVVAFPALALLLALGIGSVIDLFHRLPVSRSSARAAGAMLLVAVMGAQIVYYFGPHLALYNTQIRPQQHDQQDFMFRARAFPSGTRIYLVSNDDDIYAPIPITLGQFWGIEAEPVFVTPDQIRSIEIVDKSMDYAFFVERDDEGTQNFLRRRFGIEGGTPSPYNVPPEKQYLLFYYARSAD